MKRCRSCNVVKPDGDFYAHKRAADGLMGKCKVCWCAQVKARRRSNPAVQEYDRNRAKTPERRAHSRRIAKAWREKNKEGYRALTAVGNAIRDGRLAKGRICEAADCGRTDVHAHHDDYSKPMEVRWFCPLHNLRLRAQEKLESAP